MKYLVIALLLTGYNDLRVNHDSAESLEIHIGDSVMIKKGFYKGCVGIAVNYVDYNYNNDVVTISNVTCDNGSHVSSLIIDAKDVRKQAQ